ncbi:MAG: hypothetical protein H0V66_05880, partial [Bdellovibrionales bacterium]|nr:hypothetical protein [Bdellovibrionales bacterium]
DGERVQANYQLLSLFHKSERHRLKVEVLRDGAVKSGLTLIGVNASDKIAEAQKQIIKSVCKYEEVKTRPLCK